MHKDSDWWPLESRPPNVIRWNKQWCRRPEYWGLEKHRPGFWLEVTQKINDKIFNIIPAAWEHPSNNFEKCIITGGKNPDTGEEVIIARVF